MLGKNKKARRDFELLDKYEAGIVLTGGEVKAVRTQGVKLDGAYAKIVGQEAFLINAHIPQYSYAKRDDSYNPTRSRKLLLNKKEILSIQTKMNQKGKVTLVPVSSYSKNGRIKIELAIGKGQKSWQIKRVEQGKTEKRQAEKEMKEYLKGPRR